LAARYDNGVIIERIDMSIVSGGYPVMVKRDEVSPILAVAKEALGFYGNWESWKGSHGGELPPDTDYDKGKIAREALTKMRGMEK
jgi:hypothetical protein